jgi:NitT/TauT family transport system substrate-binding protein
MISRRRFVGSVAAAGAFALVGGAPGRAIAQAAPETGRLTLVRDPTICLAPQYVAEEMLKEEGFTNVRYVPLAPGVGVGEMLGSGEADLSMEAAPVLILNLDAGHPIVLLAGAHVGCYELFATDRVRTIRDLKGKTVAISQFRDDRHAFIASMAAHVGVDPRKDIKWVTHSTAESMKLLAEGKVDAFLAFPPEPQELRAKKIGRVVLSITLDKPWSQYFCCMMAGNREFVRKNPIATKRALRAILKANAVCAAEPERIARFLVNKGYARVYDYALQTLKEIPYARWREYDAEDTVRFYGLRLQEAGMIKSSAKKILAQGTDWRFLNELKKELKA